MSEAKKLNEDGKVSDVDQASNDNPTEGVAASGESGGAASEDSTISFLREYLANSLGLRDKPEQKLQELNLAGVAKYLASDRCKKVITMAGAGISTSAGIPDFRSPGTGLYNNLQSYDLPNPQAIFEMEFFKKNPKPFFVLAKELYPGAFKPTPCHYFIKLLSDKGKLLRHYTQNIDTLERVAGLDGDKLVECHGTFHSSHCLKCCKEYDLPWMKEQIFADKIPKCEEEDCKGVVKPDIVFFGESLPERFAELVAEDMPQCDLLIVMGTSLTVQPFASLVSRVPVDCPRLYINMEKGMQTNNPITALLFGGGFNFDGEDNYRDIFEEGLCDTGCQHLADLLGWRKELDELVQTENEKVAKSSPASASDGTKKSGASPTASKPSTPAAAKSAKPSPAGARPSPAGATPSPAGATPSPAGAGAKSKQPAKPNGSKGGSTTKRKM